ncbi:hypothetical protein AeMF1_012765 [Aphanomyces euteiches]|nr:hypothetical protein AeMF1_012765 [Aphanomyces euteiches]KAH9192039.1 hypothetical protein AeNC1_005984 [Aphanomyces euteiches]
MVDTVLDSEAAFEAVLGEAVWKACIKGQSAQIQRWIVSRSTCYEPKDLVGTNNNRKDSAGPSDFLSLGNEFETRLEELNPGQLVYSFLSHLRVHFKSGFKEQVDLSSSIAPPTTPTPTATVRKEKISKKRVPVVAVPNPPAPPPAWTTQDFPPLGGSSGSSKKSPPANHVAVTKKPQKDRRRIRSTLLSTTSLDAPLLSAPQDVQEVLLEKGVLEKFETRLMAPSAAKNSNQLPSKPSLDNHPNELLDTSNNSSPETEEEPQSIERVLEHVDHNLTPPAALYTFVLQGKLVPSTNIELQWLFSLLQKDDKDARQFAVSVLNQVSSWLEAYGVDILKLVIDAIQKANLASPLLDRFTAYIEKYEELRATESQQAGTQLPVEGEARASNRNFAVPFREDTDSRLHFRTPEETVVYSNREKARDSFLALLRTWQSAQSSMTNRQDTIQPGVVLDELLSSNHWWFAQLFVTELLQVGINPLGENDRDLVAKIIGDDKLKNADRLRKLHQRLTHNQTKQNSLALERKVAKDDNDIDAAPFTDNQRFFYEFLTGSNRHEFSSLVATVLHANLVQILNTLTSLSPSSLRKNFSVMVLQAKLLGKFLGWLHFSPYWTLPQWTNNNAAMEAASREAIRMRNQIPVPLDINVYLEASIADHTLMAHIPWICDYLMMVTKDPIAVETTYFQKVFNRLQQVYCSPRLNASPSENTLYLMLQLEGLLRSKRMAQAQSPLDGGLQIQCQHMDAIPFLVNSLYVQSCVKDVAIFRRFLQTLYQDDKQSTSRKVKLRPYVVQQSSLLSVDSMEQPVASKADSALTIAFYKQYPSLQPTVEFVVDTVITNVCHFANTTILQPSAAAFVEKLLSQVNSSISKEDQTLWLTAQVRQQLPAAKIQACRQAREATEPYCRHHIPLAMEVLISPTIPTSVKSVAMNIATEKAIASLESMIKTSLAMEFSKHIVSRMRKLKKEVTVAPVATAPTALEQLYALSKQVVNSVNNSIHEFASLVQSLPPTPAVMCCLVDTLPHVPINSSTKPTIQACMKHAFERGKPDFAAALASQLVSEFVKRDASHDEIVDLTNLWPVPNFSKHSFKGNLCSLLRR